MVAHVGGIDEILSIMKAYEQTRTIQELSCRALHYIAKAPGNQASIAEKGGIDALLEAMRIHYSSAPLQEQACGALWHIALTPGTRG